MTFNIDPSWTLFLDRDGVINARLPGDYVKLPEQFVFIEGTLEAIRIFSTLFRYVFVVTNQQGIGKGLMTESELALVHQKMTEEVNRAGGKIDRIYHAPALESEKSFMRKPSVGMGIQAKKEFRDISFKKSIMAGDSFSDMVFGKRLGMKTVLIGEAEIARQNPAFVDYVYPDLFTFANSIKPISR